MASVYELTGGRKQLTSIPAGNRFGYKIHENRLIRMNNTNDGSSQDRRLANQKKKRQNGKTLYLGAVIGDLGMDEDDLQSCKNRARTALAMLNSTCNSTYLSNPTKIRIFKPNFLSVLLYESKSWFMTRRTISKIQVFVTRWLKRIFKIF